MKIIFCILIVLYFCSCVAPQTPVATPTPPVPAQFVKLSWETGHSEREAWSVKVDQEIEKAFSAFDQAKDVENYCPKYRTLDKYQKIGVWSELVASISYYESGWNPSKMYMEPAPLNEYSIGLLQLSYGDSFCPKKPSEGDLKDPIVNLNCGIKIMGSLIKQNGVITKGKNTKGLGLARYWSVMWEHTKLPLIKARVQKLSFCN